MIIFRTNNFSGAYNKVLSLRFGIHPNIWDFTEKIAILQELKRIEYESLLMGNPVTQELRRNYILKNLIIQRAWFLYQNHQFGISQFLNCMSYFVDALKNAIPANIEQVDEFIPELDDPVEIEFTVGEHITNCIICLQNITNNICLPCHHWLGCSSCVRNPQILAREENADLQCSRCAGIVNSFVEIF
ncbi:uncharacterized protein LOC128668403 [Microplitis demolitor]|uniref:uncharacterized protein LOC128668403 n=1 Tax=Microplitis demolitor TaxID=69319 RepID=UPI00235B6EE9|nr:uncharacterized protein LOC128668403 [Microplitis demolitor]